MQKTSNIKSIVRASQNDSVSGGEENIISIESFYYNSPSNVTVVFNTEENVTSVTSNYGEMTQGVEPAFSPSDGNDWYIPNFPSILGKQIVITTAFLSNYLVNENDSISFTANFETHAPITFSITADYLVSSAFVNSFGNFILTDPQDITATVEWNDTTSVNSIVNETAEETLTNGVDYEVVSSILESLIIIKSSYLSGLTEGVLYNFVISFNVGESNTSFVRVLASNTAATLSPTGDTFSVSMPDVCKTYVTYVAASSVQNITYNGSNVSPTFGYSYDIGGTPSITFKSGYLSNLFTEAGQSADFVINFDVGEPITFTITATI